MCNLADCKELVWNSRTLPHTTAHSGQWQVAAPLMAFSRQRVQSPWLWQIPLPVSLSCEWWQLQPGRTAVLGLPWWSKGLRSSCNSWSDTTLLRLRGSQPQLLSSQYLCQAEKQQHFYLVDGKIWPDVLTQDHTTVWCSLSKVSEAQSQSCANKSNNTLLFIFLLWIYYICYPCFQNTVITL